MHEELPIPKDKIDAPDEDCEPEGEKGVEGEFGILSAWEEKSRENHDYGGVEDVGDRLDEEGSMVGEQMGLGKGLPGLIVA